MGSERRYELWAGRPNGVPEDKKRCVKAVFPPGRYILRQCSRKRGHGPNGEYCQQHAKAFSDA